MNMVRHIEAVKTLKRRNEVHGRRRVALCRAGCRPPHADPAIADSLTRAVRARHVPKGFVSSRRMLHSCRDGTHIWSILEWRSVRIRRSAEQRYLPEFGSDMVTDAINETPASARALAAISTLRSIADSRAFDRGESDALDFVKEQRSQVLAESRLFPWGILQQKELAELDSADSREIQAADIAAGIARELWYREGLVNLVRHFDYVLLNGMRLSETSAASHPYWRPSIH
jgi:hypothetical protein